MYSQGGAGLGNDKPGTISNPVHCSAVRPKPAMTHHRTPRLQSRQVLFPPMPDKALPAREALKRAQAELERCQAAFDCHQGGDSDRLRMEIRIAEQKVAAARERLLKLDPSYRR
jgi:hypothetical protein